MNLAPSIVFNAERRNMASGRAGILQTLKQMRRLVNQGKCDPVIRQAAASLVFLTPEKNEFAECEAVFDFVRDSIRYTRDVADVETLMSPQKTLALRYGDCDDQTVLLCTLLEAVGYNTRFVVAAYSDGTDFEHVYAQVFAVDQWIDCDATEQHPFGWMPPDPVLLAFERT